MKRSDRTLLQLQAALASVRTVVPEVPIEIGGHGMGAYLRLVGDVPQPTVLEGLQQIRDRLLEQKPGSGSAELHEGPLGAEGAVQLGFYPWVPFLPGHLRARLTAQSAVEYVVDFLDRRLGADSWPGGGCAVRTRVRAGRIQVTLVNTVTAQSLTLPALQMPPFRRNRQ